LARLVPGQKKPTFSRHSDASVPAIAMTTSRCEMARVMARLIAAFAVGGKA